MRTVFTVCLLASLIGLLCAEDASACWRRHRHRCCSAGPVCTEQYPVCTTCEEHEVYRALCQCAGINSCQISCPGPCYSMKDMSGYCHCGCAGTRSRGPLIPHYTIGQNHRIELELKACTYQEVDQLLGLSLEHKADIKNPNDVISHYKTVDIFGNPTKKTIAEIMRDLHIPHKP